MAFADGELPEDGGQRRRQRRKGEAGRRDETEVNPMELLKERELVAKKVHECPVPKPGGVIGEVLGFGRREKEAPPPKVQVERRKVERPE